MQANSEVIHNLEITKLEQEYIRTYKPGYVIPPILEDTWEFKLKYTVTENQLLMKSITIITMY